MRLWHYKLIPFLPTSQLLAQWRELNSIFKKQDNHILINYVYEYEKRHLFAYTQMVLAEMANRGIVVRNFDHLGSYFNCGAISLTDFAIKNPFPNHHNERYLLQCFYNLQEKYDRGQKDFSKEQFLKLYEFYCQNIQHLSPHNFMSEEEILIARRISWKNWEEHNNG